MLGREERLNWYDAGLRHLWLPGGEPEPLAVALTHGSRIVLDDEYTLLDGTAGGGTACHGFNHPHIGMAAARQLEHLPHMPLDGALHKPGARLAERLAGLLPGDLDRVLFAESGSAAMEAALAVALADSAAKHGRARRKILAFRNGWHGGTAATAALGTAPAARGLPGRALASRALIAPLPENDETTADFDSIIARHGDSLAAIVVEPLVQAGAMKFHGAEVLHRLRAAADRCGALLIFDESFTGFGRTGTLFACEAARVMPDIVTLSKALTGGTLPLAATVVRRAVAMRIAASTTPFPAHCSTFMASAIACAAANASLDLFEEEPRLEQAAEIERQLRDGLEVCRDFPGVRDVRVKGAIGVLELRRIKDATALWRRFIEAGVYLRINGHAVVLTPALAIEPYDLSTLIGTTVKVLREATRRRGSRAAAENQGDLPF